MLFRFKTFLLFSLFFFGKYATTQAADVRSDSVNILNTSIQLNLTDFVGKILQGQTSILFQAKVNGVKTIRFDLQQLVVDSVKIAGSNIAFSYNDTALICTLPNPLQQNNQRTIAVFYHGHPLQAAGDFGGFYWTNDYAFNIGVSFKADPHNYGRVWFPCFDNFVERCSFHFEITTDSSKRALCNGREDSIKTGNGTKTWCWTMKEEIPSYLASVSVANYTPIYDSYIRFGDTLPIILAAVENDTASLNTSFLNLKNAISIFENLFGKYVFNRIGYCVVPFNAGAMEHATNISYMQAIVDGKTTYENLMAHELSHHWFGDMATCESAGEMWLNEGWARYCENVFYESLYGKERYKKEVRENHEAVLHLAHVTDSAYWAVSGVPSALTYSTKTVYEKGADRVHTLRSYMGDSVFFSCVKSYLEQYKFKDVNSDKLRDYLVSCSGNTAINNFFADWIHTGGFPDFSINEKRVNKLTDNDYEVTINIQQRINHSPNYFNHVPLEIFYFDSLGNATKKQADVSGGCTQFMAHLNSNPIYIALDFDEKISDAITDEWAWVKNAFSYNLNTAKMTIYPKNQTDSSLVRVEHHWVAPDASKNHLQDIHLSDYRYWNVDGIFAPDFYANARVFYNGSSTPVGYLDNNLISTSVNDLVLLYRPNPQADWGLADSAKNFVSNPSGKSGYFDIYGLRKGEYTLAINDPTKVDAAQQIASCFPLSISKTFESKIGFNLYPNPMHEEELHVELGAVNYFSKCLVVDMLGNTVADRTIKENQNGFVLYMNGLHRGTYLVTLWDKLGGKISKEVVKVK